MPSCQASLVSSNSLAPAPDVPTSRENEIKHSCMVKCMHPAPTRSCQPNGRVSIYPQPHTHAHIVHITPHSPKSNSPHLMATMRHSTAGDMHPLYPNAKRTTHLMSTMQLAFDRSTPTRRSPLPLLAWLTSRSA